MGDLGSATPDYTMGFSEEFVHALQRFTAETSAAHLLPCLRPGQRLLDFGCGPGTISSGLAGAVAPGEMHGVDMEESQVELARSVARAHGRDNAQFHVGDVTDLPFADSYFDVAHCSNVLMHVPDTAAVLDEMMRVLKPGGTLACREMIVGSSFSNPTFGVLDRAWDMFADLLIADDGHPDMGKRMKSHIVAAGFSNVRMSLTFDSFSAPGDVMFIYGIAQQWFLSPEIMEAAIKYGASTRELCDSIGAAYEDWIAHPGAFAAVAYGEALATRPSFDGGGGGTPTASRRERAPASLTPPPLPLS